MIPLREGAEFGGSLYLVLRPEGGHKCFCLNPSFSSVDLLPLDGVRVRGQDAKNHRMPSQGRHYFFNSLPAIRGKSLFGANGSAAALTPAKCPI